MDAAKNGKDYVVVVQCEQATSRVCAGFQCEWAFSARLDAFAGYPVDKNVRYLSMSCGGCPGRAVTRKLMNLRKGLEKRERRGIESVAVHLSTCITRSSHHGPECPHLDAIKRRIALAGFSWVADSRISKLAQKRRDEGRYCGGAEEQGPAAQSKAN